MNNKNISRPDFLVQAETDALLAKAKSEISQLRDELNHIHGGTLYIKKYNNYSIFTEYHNGHERNVGKDKNRVHKLARRKYAKLLLEIINEKYRLLNESSKTLKTSKLIYKATSLLNTYDSSGLDMKRILFSPKQQKWLNQPYERNPAYPEELKFETTNKQLMRTKSELIIANRLEHYNIPYLPEMPLWFPYNMRPKYPDFTILKPNGEIIIWEHMGLMNKEDYFIKNSRKIIEYRQNGYSQNTNLIITFEEDIIEPGIIDHIIESRLLL